MNSVALSKDAFNNAPVETSPEMRRVWGSRITFIGLLCYLASQVFEIPVLPLGPSWAVWPVLSDLAAGVMVLGLIIEYPYIKMSSRQNKVLLTGLGLIIAGMFAAFLFAIIRGAVGGMSDSQRSANFGVFQIFRTVQFAVIFAITAGIPITRGRQRAMSRIIDVVLVLVLLGLIGTYFSIIPTSLLVSHLPPTRDISGPWAYYNESQMFESGTIGYNHGYISLQLMLLASLGMALRPRLSGAATAAYLSLATMGVFLSGSRAAMVAMVFLLAVNLLKRPASMVAVIAVLAVLFGAYVGLSGGVSSGLLQTAERQASIADPLDPQNLSGRTGIWHDSIAFLNMDPVRWIVGAGPGSVAQYGYNAHCLYLHITMEAGILGLMLFLLFSYRTVSYLKRFERGAKPLMWMTIAFLISALTQETFYPVPAFQHFLGLYLCSIAIALSIGSTVQTTKPSYSEAD